ncbi:MAG: sulfite exporter TauE/SafE family protein [Candidatus Sulfotelmatobacter sp.]
MSGAKLSVLIAVFFFTSVISVVTGSTSLITVPVMIALGIEAHVAVATNMLALTFMSVGGSLPFIGRSVLSRSRLLPSVVLTIIGSGLGALLLLRVPLKALQITIAAAMIGVAVFSLLNKNLGRASHDTPASHVGVIGGYAATFLLAIYGGFFSGGYVTMLTAAFVLLFGMTFLQAVATTKVINVFSSGVATLVFVWRGVVDLRLGIILGISMFLGALLGARIALFLSTVWLRRIFIAAVFGLAIKLLLPLH